MKEERIAELELERMSISFRLSEIHEKIKNCRQKLKRYKTSKLAPDILGERFVKTNQELSELLLQRNDLRTKKHGLSVQLRKLRR